MHVDMCRTVCGDNAMKHGGDIYRNHILQDHSVNLNPLGCPDEVMGAINEGIKHVHEYPDLRQESVRAAIADMYGTDERHVLGGNGASELIFAVTASVKPCRALLVSPGFSGYEYALSAVNAEMIDRYCLSEQNGFAIGEDILDRITEDTDIMYLCNPHNPTGLNVPGNLLRRICDRCRDMDCSLVVDESFLNMSSHAFSLSGYIDKYHGLYVIGSFTKLFAIPGLRAGYLLTCEANLESVSVRLPEWNMSVPAQYAAVACARLMRDTSFVKDTIQMIDLERKYLLDGIRSLPDTALPSGMHIKAYDSDSSFFLVQSSMDLYSALLKEGIMIRKYESGEFDNVRFYRIAVKDHDSNTSLLKAVKKLCKTMLTDE